MHEPRHAGRDPGPAEAGRVSLVGKRCGVRIGRHLGYGAAFDTRQRFDVRYQPGFRRVREVAVHQQHHRRHVPHGNPHGFDRHVEALRRRPGREHRYRRVGVAAVDGLVKIRLLGLGRQSCGRPAALPVDDQQRQFCTHREAHGFGLQRDAGTRTRGYADHAAIGCADCRTDCRDLVFRLEGADAQFLQAGQPVQQRRRRRDGVGTEQHRAVREFSGRGDAQRERLRAGDAAVFARLHPRGIDAKLGQRRR